MTDEEQIAHEEEQKEILAEEERLKIEEEAKSKEEQDKIDWRADALKNRAIANRLKIKLSKVPPPITKVPKQDQKIDEDVVQSVKKLEQAEAKRQFGHEYGLSPEETDIAFKFSGGKPSKEILEDSFFKAGLESLRSKKRLENNTPGSSSRSSVFSEKAFAELDEEGRKKTFESKVKSVRG